MSKRPDGFAILRAVVRHSEVFSNVRAAVDKAALVILTAQLKAKTCDLDSLKRTRKALGADTLALILKQLPAAALKSLAARVDPDRPKHAAGSAGRLRSRIMALASGTTPAQARPGPGKKRASPANGGNKRSGAGKRRTAPKPEDLIARGFWATSVMAKPQHRSRTASKRK